MSLINKIMSLINYKIYILCAQIAGAKSPRQLKFTVVFNIFVSSE
jgi:hypothetical protein